MTLLYVIFGLGPPIKNPGYAYGSEPLERTKFLTSESQLKKLNVQSS